MLSMVIFTFRPEKREEVTKRRSEEDTTYEGMTKIAEWHSAKTGRVFRLIEGGDLKTALEAFRTWSDLGRIEVVPVMKSEGLRNQWSNSMHSEESDLS